jgi:hypothetical protein
MDEGKFITLEQAIQQMLDHALVNSADTQIVVGPIVHHPSDDKLWYFIVATADEAKQFRCDQMIYTADEIKALRRDFVAAAHQRPSLVIHDIDDELNMAKLCETLWPGQRITALRQAVEAERRAAAVRAKHDKFYEQYIRHMPQVSIDVPLERGRVYHTVIQHDDWCRFYETENLADCNCNPILSRHVEPERS